MEDRMKALHDEYLQAYPKLTDDDFTTAAENVGNEDLSDEDWLEAYACHIEDVAFVKGYS